MAERNPNRMQEAVDHLKSRFDSHASMVVSYSRGSTVLADIPATTGRTPFNVEEAGVLVAYESRDYMISAADLEGLIPASGDLITEANGNVYVVAVPKPFNVYESIGPDGTVFKIHTKAVSK